MKSITVILMMILMGVIGWIANIVQIVAMMNAPITGVFIFKIVAIFVAPVGAVLGYIGMF